MSWIEKVLTTLSTEPVCGYTPSQPASSEPTALAALALAGHGHLEASVQAADWLAELQSPEGSVPVRPKLDRPRWTTSLAVLTWLAVDSQSDRFREARMRGVEWILTLRGKTTKRSPDIGHDTTLDAWPWVEGTHGWIEPTSMHLLALKSAGYNDHPRARQAARMLIDRQLPQGGCNYGNTQVLGQTLRPHVQPTGIALLGLAGETDHEKVNRSLDYLAAGIDSRTTTASLCWALLGLAAHGRQVKLREQWLESAFQRTWEYDRSPCKFALLALAALDQRTPLVTTVAEHVPR